MDEMQRFGSALSWPLLSGEAEASGSGGHRALRAARLEALGAASEMTIGRRKQERRNPSVALLKLLKPAVWSCLLRLDRGDVPKALRRGHGGLIVRVIRASERRV